MAFERQCERAKPLTCQMSRSAAGVIVLHSASEVPAPLGPRTALSKFAMMCVPSSSNSNTSCRHAAVSGEAGSGWDQET